MRLRRTGATSRFMREDSMAEVALLDVSKRYGTVEAVRNLSLSIANGEFVVLLGPTGAGRPRRCA